MTEIDYGFRYRGGIADLMLKISFQHNTAIWMARLFHDLAYFFLIIILMLEMIFGILIETFRELRIHQQNREMDMNEICFICGIKRDQLEKTSKNYEEHINHTHNVWNYVNYMIRLKFSNLQDLNAINSHAYELLNNNNITWIPFYKNELENEKNSEEDDKSDNKSDFKSEFKSIFKSEMFLENKKDIKEDNDIECKYEEI